MDIIILCGGLGTRLKSLSKGLPKSLMTINKDVVFLDIILNEAMKLEPRKIYLSLFYKPELFIKYIKDKNLEISYVIEKKKLDTGGAIKNIINKKKISNNFIVMNGDTFLFNYNLKNFKNFFFKNKKSSILAGKIKKNIRYGSIKINDKNEVTSFGSKKNYINSIVNLGVYFFRKQDFVFKRQVFSLERDFLPKIAEQKKLLALVTNFFFIDIGIPKDLKLMRRYYSSISEKINNR